MRNQRPGGDQRQQHIGQQQPRINQNYQQKNYPQMYNKPGRMQPYGQAPNMYYNLYTRQYCNPYIINANQMIPCSKYCTRVPRGNPMIPYSNPNKPNGNPNVPNGAYLYPPRNNPQAQMSPQNINDQMVPHFSSLRIAPPQPRYQPTQSRGQTSEANQQRTGDFVEFGKFNSFKLTFKYTFQNLHAVTFIALLNKLLYINVIKIKFFKRNVFFTHVLYFRCA